MSTNDKPPMPSQPKTTELPKADRIEILIQEMRVEVRGEFRALRADLEVVDNQVRVLSDRMALAERRMDDAERRAERTSDRVAQPSQHDLETAAALASEITARQALATDVAETKARVEVIEKKTDMQTVMLEKLTEGASKLAANPIVRSIATMVGTAILTWLAAHGGHS